MDIEDADIYEHKNMRWTSENQPYMSIRNKHVIGGKDNGYKKSRRI